MPLKERKALQARRRPPKPLIPRIDDRDSSQSQAVVPSAGPAVLLPEPSNNISWFLPELDGFASISDLDSSAFGTLDSAFWDCPSLAPPPMLEMELPTAGLLSSLPSLIEITETERKALDYYQKGDGFGFASKPPAWSTHAILMETATRNPAVLHLLLAASLAEVAWQNPSHRSMFTSSGRHYELGRRLLSDELADPEADPLVIMSCFWFLCLHQRRRQSGLRIPYPELSKLMYEYISSCQLHRLLASVSLDDEASNVQSKARSLSSADSRALVARLTVWLFWADSQSCFQGEGGNMAQLLSQSITASGIFAMHETSRDTLQLHWGNGYPDDQLEDDLANASALELLHSTWALVQEINEATEVYPMDREKARDLRNRLDLLRRKFPISSVFRLTESPSRTRNRLMANSDWAVANYYAVSIYLARCRLAEEHHPFCLDEGYAIVDSASALLLLIQKTLATDNRVQTERLQWPLFWVGLETTDEFKQRWILSKLNHRVLRDALVKIFLEQSDLVRIGMGRVREICQGICTNG